MMKKTLLSLLMVAAFMPLALAQDNSPLVVVSSDVTACETYTWSIDGQTYTSSTVATQLSDDSDTLFTIINRLKPIFVQHSKLKILVDRGKSYCLKLK